MGSKRTAHRPLERSTKGGEGVEEKLPWPELRAHRRDGRRRKRRRRKEGESMGENFTHTCVEGEERKRMEVERGQTVAGKGRNRRRKNESGRENGVARARARHARGGEKTTPRGTSLLVAAGWWGPHAKFEFERKRKDRGYGGRVYILYIYIYVYYARQYTYTL